MCVCVGWGVALSQGLAVAGRLQEEGNRPEGLEGLQAALRACWSGKPLVGPVPLRLQGIHTQPALGVVSRRPLPLVLREVGRDGTWGWGLGLWLSKEARGPCPRLPRPWGRACWPP